MPGFFTRPPVNDLNTNKPPVPGTPPPMFGNGNIGFRNNNPTIGSAPMGFQTQQMGRPGFELGGVPITGAQQQQVPGSGVAAAAPNMGNTSSTILPTDPNNPPTRPGFVNNKGPAPDPGATMWAGGSPDWLRNNYNPGEFQNAYGGMQGFNQGGGMQQGNKNPQQSSGVQMPQNGGKNPMSGGGSTQPVYPGRG